MHPRQASPTVLLILLCAAVFFTNLSVLMLGPLLVDLAYEFQTSAAIVGQSATSGKAGGLKKVEPLKAVRCWEPLKAVRL